MHHSVSRSRAPTLLFWILVSSFASALAAGEPPQAMTDPRSDADRRLEAAIDADPAISPALKGALKDYLGETRDLGRSRTGVAPMKDAVPASGSTAPGTDTLATIAKVFAKLQVYGDFRFRHETEFDLIDADDRNRERIRLRLGAVYEVLPWLKAGLRMTTGSREDPKSPYFTFGEEFDKYEFNLDRAYLVLAPQDLVPGGSLVIGKFANPLICYSVYSELVWDADVQPTGGALSFELTKLLPKPTWLASARLDAGGYVVSEFSGTEDAYAAVGQAAVELIPAESWKLQGAMGVYYYADLTPDGQQAVVQENLGNKLKDTNGDGVGDEFLSHFAILDPSLALTCNLLPLPVTLTGEYFRNLGADSDGNGYAVGLAVGQTKEPGDVRAYYQWQVVEQDSVFTLVSQDDFRRTTNFRGHVFGARCQVAKPVSVHCWFLVTRVDEPAPGQSDDWEWKFRVDLDVTF